MSFGKFFKDALLPVAVWTCGVLLSCFVLTVAGAPVSIVVVAVGVSFIFGMLGIVIEYARRRRFLRQLERAAEELESPAWVQEMVQCPTYAEGELEYEVLRRVGKAACDEVAEGRRQTDDYRDYIESWVHEAKLPLAAAHLILENLDGSEDDLSRVDDLGRELARVERYIDQALYYARSEVVERDYLIRRWNLKTLVTGAIKANARELIAAHVAPVCENLDFEVFTDEKWLEFILGQLIQNSIKYAREDGAKIVFSGALLDEGLASERIELTVADNGWARPTCRACSRRALPATTAAPPSAQRASASTWWRACAPRWALTSPRHPSPAKASSSRLPSQPTSSNTLSSQPVWRSRSGSSHVRRNQAFQQLYS